MPAARVTCPATSANLGPGFDALGLALALHNRFVVTPRAEGFVLRARGGEGSGAERLGEDPEGSLVVRGFQAARAALGLAPAPGLEVEVEVEVPTGRGLGSSATAVVAGVLAASALSQAEGGPALDPDRALDLAVALEGHPDNVAPCLLGGVCAALRGPDGRVVHARAAPANLPVAVAVIPLDREKSTEVMRRLLPASVPFADAVDTVGRLSLLLFALLTDAPALLPQALEDRLHQPYRGPAVPAFDEARAAGRAAGAHGVVLSGSGPTLLALAPDRAAGAAAGQAIVEVWARAGVRAVARVVDVDLAGARVTVAP
ncbi:MAG: homoserine kinase [Planctomycetes bacterium]|nr:homoserine kinase [Planctomycetota bacterium]